MTSNTDLHLHLEQVFPPEALEEKLKTGDKLTIKLGLDPTAPDLHLGHAVVLKKMRQFQDLGHEIIVIVGDTTARIGDPTGRNKMRPPLSDEDIKNNSATYLEQLGLILDLNKVTVRRNSEWFDTLEFTELLKLFSHYTVQQILQRNDFSQRYKENQPIGIHEMIYPLMQGYDSVMINADVEIGGTDQLFNCKVGRQLQESFGHPGQAVLCATILRGTDGHEKMSKSKGNYIGLTEDPNNMFGKVMSIPDDLIEEYLTLTTRFSDEKIQQTLDSLKDGANPLLIKQEIALDIVSTYHTPELAEEAKAFFDRNVRKKGDIEWLEISLENLKTKLEGNTAPALFAACQMVAELAGESNNNNHYRRIIKQGGVQVNGEKVNDPNASLNLSDNNEPLTLKIGKRGFYKLT